MSKYECKICQKSEEAKFLPFGWSEVHEEAAGVHDSAAVTWKYDYLLCGVCRELIANMADKDESNED